MFNIPKFHAIVYFNNPLSGRFEKVPTMIAFNKLPFELKVEPSQKEFLIKQGAKNVITGRIKEGKREFFSGLIPLKETSFEGNDYESIKGQKKLSLIIFDFLESSKILNVYYFNHFYIHNRAERMKFCIHFLQNLTIKKGL